MTTTTRPYQRPSNGQHALVITLKEVQPAFYTGWSGPLEAAEYDRAAILDMLRSANFVEPQELRNDAATRAALAARLQELSVAAVSGDLVVVYYSGHGATLPDLNHDELGALRDGAWCLYDGMFVDDEITTALMKFKEGVRVVLISDSCFTGTIVARSLLDAQRNGTALVIDPRGSKLAPRDIGERIYEAQKEFYDPILTLPPLDPDSAAASVLILSACDRNELSRIQEDGKGSVFSQSIAQVWDDGRFKGTFGELFAEVTVRVKRAVTEGQNPQMRPTGKQTDRPLENQRAFDLSPVDKQTRPIRREISLSLIAAVEASASNPAPKKSDRKRKQGANGKSSKSTKRNGRYRDSAVRR